MNPHRQLQNETSFEHFTPKYAMLWFSIHTGSCPSCQAIRITVYLLATSTTRPECGAQ